MSTQYDWRDDVPLMLDEAAILAAKRASEATTELLRYAREGDFLTGATFDEDACSDLAEALALALDIERKPVFDAASQPEDHATEAALKAALIRALDNYLNFERAA